MSKRTIRGPVPAALFAMLASVLTIDMLGNANTVRAGGVFSSGARCTTRRFPSLLHG